MQFAEGRNATSNSHTRWLLAAVLKTNATDLVVPAAFTSTFRRPQYTQLARCREANCLPDVDDPTTFQSCITAGNPNLTALPIPRTTPPSFPLRDQDDTRRELVRDTTVRLFRSRPNPNTTTGTDPIRSPGHRPAFISRQPLAICAVILALFTISAGAAFRFAGSAEPSRDEPSSFPDRIVLTWSDDPATTQSVTWRTDVSVTSAVGQYALATPGPEFQRRAKTVAASTELFDATEVLEAGDLAKFHSVTFRDLIPDTLYAYRVGDGTRWSEWFHIRTASREPKPFSFIYFGDAQNDVLSLWSRTIRQSYAAAPDARFMIHAGDLVNRAHNSGEWGEWFRAGGWIQPMIPSIPATGNHEYGAGNAEEAEKNVRRQSVFWKPQFTLPTNGVPGLEESTYFIDYQGARIVVLNSNEQQEAQVTWLDRVLSENPHPWTIVTFHHPVFSTAGDRDNPKIRSLWKPVLDRHRVDLVLQGHDHTYARGSTFKAETNAGIGGNLRDPVTGTVYVVSVSGPKMYEFKQDQWDSYGVDLDRRAENTQLFQVIRIDGDKLEYRSRTAVGSLYDAFDLVRDGDANRIIERMPSDAHTRTFADTLAHGNHPRGDAESQRVAGASIHTH